MASPPLNELDRLNAIIENLRDANEAIKANNASSRVTLQRSRAEIVRLQRQIAVCNRELAAAIDAGKWEDVQAVLSRLI